MRERPSAWFNSQSRRPASVGVVSRVARRLSIGEQTLRIWVERDALIAVGGHTRTSNKLVMDCEPKC